MSGSAASPDVNLADGLWTPGNPMPINLGKARRQRVMGQTAAQTTTTVAYGPPTTALSTAITALYVCPAGVKAVSGYIAHFPVFSANGASQQLLIGRSPAARATAPTYADVLYSSPVGNTSGIAALNLPVVMQPGDVLWALELNRAAGATGGWGVVGAVSEVDDPNGNLAVVSANVGSAATVVYTAPASRKAHLLAGIPDAWVGGSAYNLTGSASTATAFQKAAAAGPTGNPSAGLQLNLGNTAITIANAISFPGLAAMTLGPGDQLLAQIAGGGNGMNVNCAFVLE